MKEGKEHVLINNPNNFVSHKGVWKSESYHSQKMEMQSKSLVLEQRSIEMVKYLDVVVGLKDASHTEK